MTAVLYHLQKVHKFILTSLVSIISLFIILSILNEAFRIKLLMGTTILLLSQFLFISNVLFIFSIIDNWNVTCVDFHERIYLNVKTRLNDSVACTKLFHQLFHRCHKFLKMLCAHVKRVQVGNVESVAMENQNKARLLWHRIFLLDIHSILMSFTPSIW